MYAGRWGPAYAYEGIGMRKSYVANEPSREGSKAPVFPSMQSHRLRYDAARGIGEQNAQANALTRLFITQPEDTPAPRHVIVIGDVTQGLGFDPETEQRVQRLVLDVNPSFDAKTQTQRLVFARGKTLDTLRSFVHITSDQREEVMKRALAFWKRNYQTDYGDQPPTIRSMEKALPTFVIPESLAKGGEQAGHKYLARKPDGKGGYVYSYTPPVGRKHTPEEFAGVEKEHQKLFHTARKLSAAADHHEAKHGQALGLALMQQKWDKKHAAGPKGVGGKIKHVLGIGKTPRPTAENMHSDVHAKAGISLSDEEKAAIKKRTSSHERVQAARAKAKHLTEQGHSITKQRGRGALPVNAQGASEKPENKGKRYFVTKSLAKSGERADHKYTSRKPDGKGGYLYTYADGSTSKTEPRNATQRMYETPDARDVARGHDVDSVVSRERAESLAARDKKAKMLQERSAKVRAQNKDKRDWRGRGKDAAPATKTDLMSDRVALERKAVDGHDVTKELNANSAQIFRAEMPGGHKETPPKQGLGAMLLKQAAAHAKSTGDHKLLEHVVAYAKHRLAGPDASRMMDVNKKWLQEAASVTITKSLMKAGGPFIGPKGGKWADAAHTIPWKAAAPVHAPVDDGYEGPIKHGMKLAEIEDAIRNESVEHLCILDKKGNQLHRDKGEDDHVKITHDKVLSWRKSRETTLTHNHPKSGPLSPSDFNIAIHANAKELRAVTKDGTWVATRTKPNWGVAKKHMDMERGSPHNPIHIYMSQLWHKGAARAGARMDAHIRSLGGTPGGRNDPHYKQSDWDRFVSEEVTKAYNEGGLGFQVTFEPKAGVDSGRGAPTDVRKDEEVAKSLPAFFIRKGLQAADHKYISRKPDGKGSYVYTYADVHDKVQKLLHGNLGIERTAMPQIRSAALPGFLKDLESRGVRITHEDVKANTLRATQATMHSPAIGDLAQSGKDVTAERRIIISGDGFVLDGHHRWAAAHVRNPASRVQVIRVHLPIGELLQEAHAHEGVEYALSAVPLIKGEARGGKYYRRVPTGNPKRPWRYFYTHADYVRAHGDSSHIGGQDPEGYRVRAEIAAYKKKVGDAMSAVAAAISAGKIKGTPEAHLRVAKQVIAKHAKTFDKSLAAIKALAPKDADVSGRVKMVNSALNKLALKPKYGTVGGQQDTTGMRIMCNTIDEVKNTVNAIKAKYEIVTEDDYIKEAKSDGYRSHHLIIKDTDGLQKEIQVRTLNQHKFAEFSHDIYKPQTPEQIKSLEIDKAGIEAYSLELSAYLFELDQGKKPSKKPVASEMVRRHFNVPEV